MTISVGIIGMGRSGWELHGAYLHRAPGYRVVAVCDQAPERLAQAADAFGAEPYVEWRQLLQKADVQLVVVAAVSNLHAEMAIAAMKAGKDVVVEKPMATSLAEAHAMLEESIRSARLLTVFHNRRWDRDYLTLKGFVEQGLLGELLTLDSRVMTYGSEWANYGVPHFDPQWRLRAAHGGGFLADWGPHLLEQVLDLTKQFPESVSAQLRGQLWTEEVDDYFHLRLVFPSGLLVTLEATNNARMALPRWFVMGTEGTLWAEGAWGHWTEMRVRRSFGSVEMDLTPLAARPNGVSRHYDVDKDLSAVFYADLAEALVQGRPPAIPAVRGRNITAILEAARLSSAEGRTIEMRLLEGLVCAV